MQVPKDLKYTDEHEWLQIEGDTAIIGITDYAQGELGDLVFIELPQVGDTVAQGDAFGNVEAVKAVSDLFAPVSGEIVEINELLEEDPETVNRDPYADGWMIKVKFSDASELDSLMDAAAYKDYIS